MAIPPLLALGSAVGAGVAAGSAVRAAGSGFASMLRSALGGAAEPPNANAPDKPAAPAADPVGSTRALDRDVARFGRDLAALLAQKGIATGAGLSLALDALGKVRVAGDHPEGARIEALFAANGELADTFRELASRAESLRALGKADDASNVGAGLGLGRFVLHVERDGARYDLSALSSAT
ncbi:MAG: hypothetical protein WED34_04345 [Planctomycetales bacterium]